MKKRVEIFLASCAFLVALAAVFLGGSVSFSLKRAEAASEKYFWSLAGEMESLLYERNRGGSRGELESFRLVGGYAHKEAHTAYAEIPFASHEQNMLIFKRESNNSNRIDYQIGAGWVADEKAKGVVFVGVDAYNELGAGWQAETAGTYRLVLDVVPAQCDAQGNYTNLNWDGCKASLKKDGETLAETEKNFAAFAREGRIVLDCTAEAAAGETFYFLVDTLQYNYGDSYRVNAVIERLGMRNSYSLEEEMAGNGYRPFNFGFLSSAVRHDDFENLAEVEDNRWDPYLNRYAGNHWATTLESAAYGARPVYWLNNDELTLAPVFGATYSSAYKSEIKIKLHNTDAAAANDPLHGDGVAIRGGVVKDGVFRQVFSVRPTHADFHAAEDMLLSFGIEATLERGDKIVYLIDDGNCAWWDSYYIDMTVEKAAAASSTIGADENFSVYAGETYEKLDYDAANGRFGDEKTGASKEEIYSAGGSVAVAYRPVCGGKYRVVSAAEILSGRPSLKTGILADGAFIPAGEGSGEAVLEINYGEEIVLRMEGAGRAAYALEIVLEEEAGPKLLSLTCGSAGEGPAVLRIGEKAALRADVGGVSAERLEWSVSDEDVLSLKGGEVEALAGGSASVFVSYAGQTLRLDVRVSYRYEIVLDVPSEIKAHRSATVGVRSVTDTITAAPVEAYSVEYGIAEESSPRIARIDADGNLSALGEGKIKIKITVTAAGISEAAYASILLTPATEISVKGPDSLYGLGATAGLAARLSGADEQTRLAWLSLTPTIVSVDETGSLTAVGYGHGIVAAEADGVRAEHHIYVVPTHGGSVFDLLEFFPNRKENTLFSLAYAEGPCGGESDYLAALNAATDEGLYYQSGWRRTGDNVFYFSQSVFQTNTGTVLYRFEVPAAGAYTVDCMFSWQEEYRRQDLADNPNADGIAVGVAVRGKDGGYRIERLYDCGYDVLTDKTGVPVMLDCTLTLSEGDTLTVFFSSKKIGWFDGYDLYRLNIGSNDVSCAPELVSPRQSYELGQGDLAVEIEAKGREIYKLSYAYAQVDGGNFTVGENGIALKAEYLASLGAGLHSFCAFTDCGSVKFEVEIAEKQEEKEEKRDKEEKGCGSVHAFPFAAAALLLLAAGKKRGKT